MLDFYVGCRIMVVNRKYRWIITSIWVIALILSGCGIPTQTLTASSPTKNPTTSFPTNTAKAALDPTEEFTPIEAAPTRVLFIGNSLTFFNDLPGMFAEIAQSGGYEVEVEMIAHGGWTLADHVQSTAITEKIKGGSWDYVVLQEKSRLPAIPDQRDEQMVPAVRILEERIKESGAETILFMTWGTRDGLPEAGYDDYAEMQSQIESGTLEIGKEFKITVAPVGIAWQSALERAHNFNLWQLDGIHPAREGTYLSALVFYALIFQQSPAGLNFKADLPEETADLLQAVAAETVLENYEVWKIP
jgi:hypothetical protein